MKETQAHLHSRTHTHTPSQTHTHTHTPSQTHTLNLFKPHISFLIFGTKGAEEDETSSAALPPPPPLPRPRLLKTLLDLGAGDGEVTANMAPYFERVFATETSRVMRWRLEEKGYVVLDPWTWNNESVDVGDVSGDAASDAVAVETSSTPSSSSSSSSSTSSSIAPRHYDVIACLNLLDRCSKPLALLHQIYDRLEPSGGRLVVALVLPFNPYVEFGPLSPEPEEKLLVDGDSIEEQINSLVDSVFAPIGFSLEAITRLPYLCEGDLSQAFYVLEDVVFVFRKTGGGGEGGNDGSADSEGDGGDVEAGMKEAMRGENENATTITVEAEADTQAAR